MNKSKPTPGPWYVGERHSKREDCLQIPIIKRISEDDPKSSYAVAWVVNSASVNYDSSDEANARLIAAAPKMYEALKAIAHWLADANVCCFPRELLHAAIDKVENREARG